MAKKNYPLLIELAIKRVPGLFRSCAVRHARPGTVRAMRPERTESLIILVIIFLQACCLCREGAILRVNNVNGTKHGRPLTIKDMMALANFCKSNVDRCIHDLWLVGFIVNHTQIKRITAGTLEVSTVLRMFTKKFWMALGLWSLFVESVKHATQQGKVVVHIWFKTVTSAISKSAAKSKAAIFMAMNDCQFRMRGRKCWGGRNKVEVCDLCKRLGMNL